ncbi:hypothetical protein B0T14DRAFT_233392 [Immersiella caudata]|uniref:Uncharacterized protein n=1 Tax=Immersiella caudata TaxID=314043 RepID=A0AA39WS48_9PEZI|nr:hypothetical protein B0T14DRAFT_233392 [Immersiella caudata]
MPIISAISCDTSVASCFLTFLWYPRSALLLRAQPTIASTLPYLFLRAADSLPSHRSISATMSAPTTDSGAPCTPRERSGSSSDNSKQPDLPHSPVIEIVTPPLWLSVFSPPQFCPTEGHHARFLPCLSSRR